jgi:mono/diheme cytochrome c family protein
MTLIQTPGGPRSILVLALLALGAGCEADPARFRSNRVYARKQEETVGEKLSPRQLQDVADALAALFGTPDDPYVIPAGGLGLDALLDARRLKFAAGPVGRDQSAEAGGLYRQHCVHCHGVTGDGAGPTAAFLNPYPRDFRRGIFKFKSTPKGSRPTRQDLHRTLVEGIPGTAMPSFRLLPEGELEALIDYVIYLSMRGEVERALLEETADLDAEGGERLDTSPENLIEEKLASVVRRWQAADGQVTPVPPPPTLDPVAAAARGRELFFGSIANCVKCHGELQLGDGQVDDYDDWTKEFYDWAKAPDAAVRRAKVDELVALGGLSPRTIRPRNLRTGVYRGGRRPLDLYWRIHDGIDGTPMPGSLMKPEGAPLEAKGLTPEDIWSLVEYVRSLPYDALSRPHAPPAYGRDRM